MLPARNQRVRYYTRNVVVFYDRLQPTLFWCARACCRTRVRVELNFRINTEVLRAGHSCKHLSLGSLCVWGSVDRFHNTDDILMEFSGKLFVFFFVRLSPNRVAAIARNRHANTSTHRSI